MANIYKVYIDDPAAGDVAVWTMEAANPASAISKVMRRVSYGKSARVESFEVSAELEVRDMTYAEYKAAQQGRAVDIDPLCPECHCELHLTTAGDHVCRNEACGSYR